MATKSGQGDMNELKAKVLIGRIGYLSSELGDPARYFPALRAKGVLFTEDCEKIKAKVTASEKVYEMVELIHKRHSEKDGHAMDVLMEALRKQRVQAHIARELQRALARAKDQSKAGGDTPSPMAFSPNSDPASVTPSQTHTHLGHSYTASACQNSLPAVPPSSLTTAVSSSTARSSSPQFEMHPQYGALPPGRPSNTVAPPTSVQPSSETDPVFGVLPGTPPGRQGDFRSAQEGGSLVETMSTATESSVSMQYRNGDMERGDRRYSDLSYATTSGTVYSSSSTEQSGVEFPRTHREFPDSLQMEAKYDELQSVLKQKNQEVAQLKRENVSLSDKYRELEDQHMDLKKQHEQLREKMRSLTISEQQYLLESYRPGRLEEPEDLQRQLQEKAQHVAALQRQVEQFQQENQQLQLSLSTSSASSRPHHLPIASPVARPPAIHRSTFTPARSPHQAGLALSGPAMAAGITPMRSVRIGDSLNQHNIHLQHSRSFTSPGYSPAREPGKTPAIFSPGDREGGGSKGLLFSPGSGKRLSTGSGDTPMGESYFKSSNSSLNSSGSKGSAGVTLQTAPNAEHSTMV